MIAPRINVTSLAFHAASQMVRCYSPNLDAASTFETETEHTAAPETRLTRST